MLTVLRAPSLTTRMLWRVKVTGCVVYGFCRGFSKKTIPRNASSYFFLSRSPIVSVVTGSSAVAMTFVGLRPSFRLRDRINGWSGFKSRSISARRFFPAAHAIRSVPGSGWVTATPESLSWLPKSTSTCAAWANGHPMAKQNEATSVVSVFFMG